jgi:hypothetical protein
MTLTALERPTAQRPPWFASWFDSIHYHKLYAQRDDTEAAGFIDELIQRLEPAKQQQLARRPPSWPYSSRVAAFISAHPTEGT